MRSRPDKTPKSRRWWLVVVSIVVVVVLLVAVGVTALVLRPTAETPVAQPTATLEATPTASSTPTSKSEPVPGFYTEATFDNWTRQGTGDEGTQFSANGDTVTSGASALRIDSDTYSRAAHVPLTQTVNTQAGTEYTFSAWVVSPEVRPVSSPISISMGSEVTQTFEFPTEVAEWTPVSWTYTTAPGETSIQLGIAATGPIQGFVLDELTAAPTSGGANVVSNGSFDSFSSPNRIASSSLIFTTGRAVLDVAWFTRNVSWSIVDEAGNAVGSGVTPTDGGIAPVPMQNLSQGFYTATVDDASSPGKPIETDLMILDDEVAPVDTRFGAAGKIYRPFYQGVEGVTAQVGITSVRSDVNWLAEEIPGQYDFDPTWDDLYSRFNNLGVSVLPLSIGKNPNWDGGKSPTSAAGVAAYGQFSKAIVDRFGQPAVEIQNEMNTKRFNTSTCGIAAECYLPLLRSSYEAVKSAHPDAIVVGPANAQQDDPFLTALYKAGGLNYLDAVSYHPYEATPEPLIANIQQAQSRIAEYSGGAHKPIWLTEFGWTSNNGPDSETLQADYLVRSEVIAFANGVERAYWYSLVNDSTKAEDHEGNFGMFRSATDKVPFEPKLTAMAQALLIRQIGGKEFVANESLSGSVYSYLFGTGPDAVRVAWSTSGGSVNFPSEVPLTVTTATGVASLIEPVGGQVTVPLGEKPVYVEGATSAAALAAG
jgi:hypothetical protein